MLKDSIEKRLDTLKEKIKFYRNIVFAIMSGIIWSIYNSHNPKTFWLVIIGSIFFIIFILRLKFLEAKENKLIDKLEELE